MPGLVSESLREQLEKFPFGFELAPAAGTYAQLHKIASWTVLNPNLLLRAGVIDPDFRGEVHALFTCTGQEEFGSVDK